jgi:hypothetical protein
VTDAAAEIILPFPTPIERLGPVTDVRSTLLASSLQSLKTHGHYDRYIELLPKQFHESVVHCIAGQWFPISTGYAHYEACDKLGLSMEQQREIGADVSRRLHETFLSVVVQMAKGVGVTPWTVLHRGNLLWTRVWRGGGMQATKLGPKDALIEVGGLTLLQIPYVRTAAQGLYQMALGMFAKRAHVRYIPEQSRAPTKLATLHASWV